MSDEDDVGYGKPPVQHRFQPGVSGNPAGRPRRANETVSPLLTMIAEELEREVEVGGIMMPVSRLIARQLVAGAGKGDPKALKAVLQMGCNVLPHRTAESGGHPMSADEARARLTEMKERARKHDEEQKARNAASAPAHRQHVAFDAQTSSALPDYTPLLREREKLFSEQETLVRPSAT